MATEFVNHILTVSLVGLFAWAAISDYRTYIIPNRISLAIAALYPAFVVASPTNVDWRGGLIVGGVMLVLGLLLFRFRVMGGGDIKLLVATSLWAGPTHVATLIIVTAFTGLLLTGLTISHFRYQRPLPGADVAPDETAAMKLRETIPYGIAIALGGFAIVPKIF